MLDRSLTRVAALVVGGALTLTACAGGAPGASSASSGSATEPITLTVATFNEFGYDDLYAEYMAAHPTIKVVQKKAATSNEARDNMNTRLAAGSGLSDVEAVEVDWLPDLIRSGDKFADLNSADVAGRWLEWKSKAATTPDGKLIGYGTDIGPEAVCYRSDLFAKAGLPTDRAEVAKLLGSSWDDYFALGRQFVAKTPKVAWFDSAGAVFQARLNQMANPYSSSSTEEKVIPLDQNTAIKDAYTQTLKASVDDKLSAGLGQWSQDWTNSFQKGTFATMLCPSWMLGVVQGNAAGVKGWDVANAFPGGGGNWGGSYLTVPLQGAHPEEAKALAAWLTAPEQQIKAFKAKGTFPSQVKALSSDELRSVKNAFFNDAPVGQIFADRAAAVQVMPFKGPNYFAITTAISDAINRVDVDKKETPDSSWAKAVEEVAALG
jgi:cellobiose transport system substrate-binding protein